MKMRYIQLILIAGFFWSCGNSNSENSIESDSSQVSVKEDEIEKEDTVFVSSILLWDTCLTSVAGNSPCAFTHRLGDTLDCATKPTDTTRWYFARDSKSNKGWVAKNKVYLDSYLAVAITDISFFTKQGSDFKFVKKIKAGTLMAVSRKTDSDYTPVCGMRKGFEGFINTPLQLSTNPVDLKIALLYERAARAQSASQRQKLFKEIEKNLPNTSPELKSAVEKSLGEVIQTESHNAAGNTDSDDLQVLSSDYAQLFRDIPAARHDIKDFVITNNGNNSYKISFTIEENRLTSKGDKTIYVQIINPENDVVSEGNNTFTGYGEVKKYTFRDDFFFDGNSKKITHNWIKSSNSPSGEYYIYFWCDEGLMGVYSFKVD